MDSPSQLASASRSSSRSTCSWKNEELYLVPSLHSVSCDTHPLNYGGH